MVRFFFDAASQELLVKLDRMHYRDALVVSGCIHGSNISKVFTCLGWLSLADRRREEKKINIRKRNVFGPIIHFSQPFIFI
jgi:hypothetical protein